MAGVKDPQVQGSAETTAQPLGDDFDRLQQLILGPDYSRALRSIAAQSETDRVAAVVAEAIQQRAQTDQGVQQAIEPAVTASLDQMIQKQPHRITNVLYPIIGPAIRKSVAAALAEMMNNLNDILSQSLSMKAWWWRIAAWRSGISYGEFALLKTLLYQVDQVLLIHKDTGLLIAETNTESVISEDTELVTSMLTAINDFVSDSFKQPGSRIESIRFGEHTIEIIVGPMAVLAAKVKGSVTPALVNNLNETLEVIHQRFFSELEYFDGNKTPFTEAQPLLSTCLLHKAQEKPRRKPWLAYGLVSLLIIGCCLKFGYWWYAEQKKADIVQAIKKQPDYILINQSQTGKQLNFVLLRDPATPPPEALLAAMDTAPWQVGIEAHSAPLHPTAIQTAPEPTAGQRWRELVAKVQSTRLYFSVDSNQLSIEEANKIPLLVNSLESIAELATTLGIKHHQIVVTGFADPSGDPTANAAISRNRAQAVADLLTTNGLSENLITVWGVGHLNALDMPTEDQRIVTIQILSSEPASWTP
ncbi:OmpA family protein [Ketobacter sp. MCCC 1A13808]|uniref:OmpA family protein n=1 Tax=Ketobacter sp. MCCC 1A13808 TaxID=2602738 RepID=UPI0012ECA7D1|nr:OmpA family protein [Ketobacter sp. MCCC 1A13808]MVF14479.1 OmpA family protein [Ketobacter sp. MCCC 1A13808]